MSDDGSPRLELWCPSCFATVADAPVCPSCGMAGQDGADAAQLRIVVSRIHEIASERAELQYELDTLVQERHQLFLRVRPAADESTFTRLGSETAPSRPEWRPERVRDVLLWLGALLLVIAAITFAAVAWTRLGPAGRAAILLGVTVASAALTRFVRPRLRPTAEALAAITIALALVDWGVAGGTGLRGDLSRAAWWAIGLLLVAVVCAAVADRIDLTALRLGATVLAPVAAIFALAAWSPEPTVVVVMARDHHDRGDVAAGGRPGSVDRGRAVARRPRDRGRGGRDPRGGDRRRRRLGRARGASVPHSRSSPCRSCRSSRCVPHATTTPSIPASSPV